MSVSAFDSFKLCWDVIQWSQDHLFDNSFFNAGHCSLLDSRDNNFDLTENRLAYIYKYGCFNILMLEKCISKFLNEYPAVETFLPLENFKVCSLSNGPGLDVVGLLWALRKTNKRLRCNPFIKAVNFYESWSNLFKLTINTAYPRIDLKSYFHISPDNISLIQGDVFSKLSTEAKNYISDSNVLLMVKVFVSSKATPTVFGNSLREIFSLIKPGTLIFFIGSKTNTKRFSKSKSLKRYVKCIYGPQKVTVENLSYDESITNLVGTKPLDSGYADFMVWQKKAVVDIKEVSTKSKKKNRRKTKTSDPLADTVTEECRDDSDVESEMSFTSESKYSDASSDDLSDTNSSVLVSPDLPKSEISELEQDLSYASPIHSAEENASSLEKVNIEVSNYEKETSNLLQNKTDSKSDLTNTTHEIEYESKISVDKYIIKNVNTSNESKNSEMSTANHGFEGIAEKKLNARDIKFETSIIADINSRLLSNINQFTEAENNEISETLSNEKSQAQANNLEKKKNSQTIKFETSVLTNKTDSKILSNTNSIEGIKSNKKNKMSQNVNSPLKKGNILQYNVSCANTSANSVNKTLEINLVNPFTSDVNQKDIGDTCSKKSKNKTKNISLELKTDNGNFKQSLAASKMPSSKSQSCENLCCNNNISSTENAHSGDVNDTQALLQKCESLVTSLEKLTAEIKNDITSPKDTNFVEMCCSSRQTCGNCRVCHSHNNCVNSAFRYCCRQMYGCQMMQNSCRSCSCMLPCGSRISRFYDGRPTNISRPYITIPLENEDLLHILTLKK